MTGKGKNRRKTTNGFNKHNHEIGPVRKRKICSCGDMLGNVTL
jgi:hypothetical protein